MESSDSLSQLTEFPRLESEENQSGVTGLINKFLKFPIFTGIEYDNNSNSSSGDKQQEESKQSSLEENQEKSKTPSETNSYSVDLNEGRSLQNVLRRLSSLVALGSSSGTRYADTELAKYWMPDDVSKECYECGARFSTLRRRHHCRVCGQIFCSRCCSQRIPGQICGCAGGLRVCTYCCKVVLSYLRTNDMSSEISGDLQVLQENLQIKFPDEAVLSPVTPQDNFMLDRATNSPYLRTSNKELLQELFRQLYSHLPTQQQRYRLLRYNGVWRGSDIVQWIMENTSDSTRSQANAVCRLLLNEGFIECVTEQNIFADYMLYRPAIIPAGSMSDENSPTPSNLLTGSVSSFCLDLNLDDSSARLIRSPKLEDKKLSPGSDEDGILIGTDAAESMVSPQWCSAVVEAGREHLRQLMSQCLSREALHLSWLDILMPLCLQAADITTPDVYSGDMDIRTYVQIKKVPDGSPKDCCVVNGVVLTKNVAHRGMPQQLTMPSILLLDCSVAYQRVEGKVVSLEPLLLQEQEYLARCAARILALRPAVVLVRGGVARAAQDALRAAGVALAVRVRSRALRRVARAAAADVVASVDSRIATPRMGNCKSFYVKNYESKTLMVLEGCAESKLGCCIILRGAPIAELVRVKRVVRFMLLAAYNWRLEQSFLTDTGATLPDGGISFVDGSKDCSPDIGERDIIEETKDGNNETLNSEDTNEKPSEKMQTNKPSSSIDNQEFENSGVQSNDEDIPVKETIDAVKPRMSKISRSQISGEIKTDPLQANRKSNNSTPSCGVPISDFSDPLRARQMSIDEEVFLPKCDTQLTSDSHGKRWTTEDTVLSMSPHVKVTVPFLETELGRKCHLRQYFCTPLFPPTVTQHAVLTPKSTRRKLSRPQDTDLRLFKEPHPFITQPLCKSIEDPQIRASLAHYRATGGQMLAADHKPGCPNARTDNKDRKNLVSQISNPNVSPEARNTDMDPLAPENHQRLSLLFFSYSNRSANAPDFCVNPWIVCMEMYGSNDISLGNFLDRYCFNTDYKCPSPTCQTSMVQHVRRFVHADSCITITCNTVGMSTNKTLPTDDDSRQSIMWWCRCTVCTRGAASASVRLARDSLSLSLAKYLELRLRAPRYARSSACPHSLHAAHAHYFARGTTTACFRYIKIKSWDITLPPAIIFTNYNTKSMRTSLINQVNDLMLKGHELFTNLSEGDFEKDYAAFKQHMEQINLALTSSHLQTQESIAGVVRSLWAVTDSLVAGEKLLRDAADKWSSPPIAAKPVSSKINQESTGEEKLETEDVHQQEQATGEVSENTTKVTNSTDEHGCDEDDEKGDKKTIRAILSQLLSNSQPANQHGMIISGGLVPVVVFAGEIGSVVAAGLASVQYHQQLQALFQQSQSSVVEQDEPEPSKEKPETDGKAKCNKNTEHIEVLLKDGLLCRVYHAVQFKKLRALFLSQLSSNTQIVDSFASKTDNNQIASSGEIMDTSRAPEEKLATETTGLGRHVKNKSDGNIRSGGTLCEVEEGFIRSLSRCVAWTARGGKSGSTFCKTKDDRYVLKEMSKLELQLFLELAPHYFNYITTCQQQKLPSLLGRIVGVYSVGGAGGGVLVMENLFYGRGATLQHRFDLKGTRRNRLVPDTAQPEAVLMDENLLTLHWESPLYLQAHSAAVLWSAIERDSTFLADHHVMDYSLLLGVDETNNELVIGIIDYIRTFTWDKKLEHIVKKGLGSGLPTIVSPQLYKQRFCSAMKKYFLQSPNQWDGLHRGLICKSTTVNTT